MSLQHQIIWEGPRTGKFARYWLSPDHDGRVLLTSSGEQNEHVIVRLESGKTFSEPVELTARRYGKEALVVAPSPVSDGYIIVTPKNIGQFLPVQVPALDPVPPGTIALEGYM